MEPSLTTLRDALRAFAAERDWDRFHTPKNLAAALSGSLGIGPTANLNPERTFPSMFEPIHGSAFDIAGKGVANPVATFWTASMMLEHLGHPKAAADVVHAIERVIVEGPDTPDMKGKASTSEVGTAIAEAVRRRQQLKELLHIPELPSEFVSDVKKIVKVAYAGGPAREDRLGDVESRLVTEEAKRLCQLLRK